MSNCRKNFHLPETTFKKKLGLRYSKTTQCEKNKKYYLLWIKRVLEQDGKLETMKKYSPHTYQKRLLHRYFPVNYVKCFGTAQEQVWTAAVLI